MGNSSQGLVWRGDPCTVSGTSHSGSLGEYSRTHVPTPPHGDLEESSVLPQATGSLKGTPKGTLLMGGKRWTGVEEAGYTNVFVGGK